MNEIYNIYCDESCHLENDHQKAMVLGAVWCPQSQSAAIARHIRAIKVKHDLPSGFEIKWTKVSQKKINFYLELIDFFFSDPRLHFRAVVIPDKSKLNHVVFDQSHDDFYYKIYFHLLKVIFRDDNRYRVYLDIKDTRSQEKVNKLHTYLSNAHYDFNKDMIERIQHVHSNEVEQLQLTDMLIGAVGYLHRGLTTSEAKMAVINRIQDRSGRNMIYGTLPTEQKFNLLIWNAQVL